MAIAGIEGLAQGFMQGMALKRQNDRQDVLDAQNLEKFGMDKERFATQQAASAFELQNAQTNAANAATDRTRALAIQANSDATLANMRKLWSLGDNAEAIHGEVEKLHQANGEQGAYKRDAAGKIITDKSGVATWVNKDGSERRVNAKGAKMSYWMAANPNEAAKNQLETDNTIAKEERAAKTAATAAATLHSYRMSEQSAADKNANYRAALTKPPKEPDVLPANLLPYFTEEVEVGKDRNGAPMMKKATNQAAVDSFLQWSTENKTAASPKAYQLWRSSKPVIQGATRPQVGGKGDVVGDWIKSRNIGTQDELNSAIAELRAKNPNWSKEQLKQAFVNAGVME